MNKFDSYTKQKEFLVCVDSDGCAMDTMNSKHLKCFGPQFVKHWKLEDHRETALKIWNSVNLFSMTRGVNRFLAVVKCLELLQKEGLYNEDFQCLKDWTQSASELSNKSLKAALDIAENAQLRTAFLWSEDVNSDIKTMEDEGAPFENVKEILCEISKIADIAAVSSANKAALEKEWNEFGLANYTRIICSQEEGSKAYCIQRLLEKGYDKQNVIMIGDAPGDMAAAEKNGVWYYPIIPGRENKSWADIMETAIIPLTSKCFSVSEQVRLKDLFTSGLQ